MTAAPPAGWRRAGWRCWIYMPGPAFHRIIPEKNRLPDVDVTACLQAGSAQGYRTKQPPCRTSPPWTRTAGT